MSSPQTLHAALLRPAILHILRAIGFHGARPSVIDALTSLAQHYLLLLASATTSHAQSNHSTSVPTVTDVRMALSDCGAFMPSMTLAEEEWAARLRRPIAEYREELGIRAKEQRRRDEEDTRDVTQFLEWIKGDVHKEIRRVAGMLKEPGPEGVADAVEPVEDYLTVLKKRHSKTGEESRYQGTVLGKPAEDRIVKIEGPGPVDDLKELRSRVMGRGVKRKRDEEMADSPVSERAVMRDTTENVGIAST